MSEHSACATDRFRRCRRLARPPAPCQTCAGSSDRWVLSCRETTESRRAAPPAVTVRWTPCYLLAADLLSTYVVRPKSSSSDSSVLPQSSATFATTGSDLVKCKCNGLISLLMILAPLEPCYAITVTATPHHLHKPTKTIIPRHNPWFLTPSHIHTTPHSSPRCYCSRTRDPCSRS